MEREATHRAIEAIWRIESARLIGAIARVVRDVGTAEELAQDALVLALEQWPREGIPTNPGAWLTAAARNRAIDLIRRRATFDRKAQEIGRDAQIEESRAPDFATAADDEIGDDLLGLIFAACHPTLAIEARVALTLRVVGGLRTDEIARAFLVPEPTVAQRLVRARRTLLRERVTFEVPAGDDLRARLPAVLEVIYLIFNEGYAATSGREWMRPQLCQDALRLGRVLAGLMPREAEVHGLVALMEIHASRMRARRSRDGAPILLGDQNRAHWDPLLIRRGLAALERAGTLAGSPGPYALQAAIAACHARARTLDETDWARIAELYGELGQISPSPVVALNRAVAIARAIDWEAGLAIIDSLRDDPMMREYAAYHAARGDLLAHLGRYDEARQALSRAAALTRNDAERAALAARIASFAPAPTGASSGTLNRPG